MENPSLLRNGSLERNFEWMRTVSPEEAKVCKERWMFKQRQIAYNKKNNVSPVSSARKLNTDAKDKEEIFSHSEEFCENLEVLCDKITKKEQELLAASDERDEKRIEKVRQQLDNLYQQFIYI